MSFIDKFSSILSTSDVQCSGGDGTGQVPEGVSHCSYNILVSAQKSKTPTNRQFLPHQPLQEIERTLHDGLRHNHMIQDLYIMVKTGVSTKTRYFVHNKSNMFHNFFLCCTKAANLQITD